MWNSRPIKIHFFSGDNENCNTTHKDIFLNILHIILYLYVYINKNNNTILLEIVIDNKVVETKHIYNGIR